MCHLLSPHLRSLVAVTGGPGLLTAVFVPLRRRTGHQMADEVDFPGDPCCLAPSGSSLWYGFLRDLLHARRFKVGITLYICEIDYTVVSRRVKTSSLAAWNPLFNPLYLRQFIAMEHFL